MEQEQVSKKERILRLSEVKERTGLSRSTIYLAISKGGFPQAVNLSIRCVGWLESEVDAWIAARVARSRHHATNLQMTS